MSDQRRHPRVPVRQRVWCEGHNVTLYVQALNVSEGGLFVRTANPPPVGGSFRVSFDDLQEGEVVLQVEVVWTREGTGDAQPGIGLRIVDFEKGAETFSEFVAKHLGSRAPGDDEGP